MGEVIIDKLDDEVIRRLEARAAGKGRTLEDEARDILTDAAKPAPPRKDKRAIMERIANMSGGKPLDIDIVELIREDRNSH